LTFAFIQTKVELTSEILKVPKERSKLEINLSLSSKPIALENAKIIIYGEDVITEKIFPELFTIPLYPNSVNIKCYILLEKDKAYKISCFIIDGENNFLVEKIFYLRRVQGNAMEIDEEQYIRFSLDEKERWTLSQANDRAKSYLEELKANGLKIAIEKYPENKEFPVQNNMDWQLETLSWDEEDQALLEQAISNPNYKDVVQINLSPPKGDNSPIYEAFYSFEPPQSMPACWNTIANVKMKIYLYTGIGLCPYVDWGGIPIKAEISFRNFVYNRSTNTCSLKTITKEVTVSQKHDNNICEDFGGLYYGEINEVIGFAMEGYNFVPIKSIRFYTSDSETGISSGTCHKDSINCEGNQIYIPIWDSGSENVYVSQAGNNPTDLLYEYKISGTNILSWEVIATLKHTDLDPDLHPEKIVMYQDLQRIRNFWKNYYSALIPDNYMQYKACILDMGSWGYSFEYKCINPIMTLDDGSAYWGIPPNWTPLYHLAGHWLQYKLQNNFIKDVQENYACEVLNSEDAAFSEGFANWHKSFVQIGIAEDHPENNETYAWCHPEYFPEVYNYPKKTAIFSEGFIGNMFDKYNSDDINPQCNPWPNPGAPCSDERLDENGNLIGWDYVYVPLVNLEKWKGNQNNNITQFITNWTKPDMPLYNEPNLCPLLTTHYFEDLCQ